MEQEREAASVQIVKNSCESVRNRLLAECCALEKCRKKIAKCDFLGTSTSDKFVSKSGRLQNLSNQIGAFCGPAIQNRVLRLV